MQNTECVAAPVGLPGAPTTPPQDGEQQQRPQRGELPAPKDLAVHFGSMGLASSGETSPRSPFAADHEQQRRAAAAGSTTSEDCGSPTGSGGGGGGGTPIGSVASDLAAAAAAADPPEEPRWRQAPHDRQEPILQSSSERFCLLPIK